MNKRKKSNERYAAEIRIDKGNYNDKVLENVVKGRILLVFFI